MAAVDSPPSRTEADVPARPGPGGGPPPRTVLLIGGLILVAILVVAAVVVGGWRMSHRGEAARAHEVTGAVGGRDAATLDLLTGVTAVTVRGADLGHLLYRIQSPQTPSATEHGDRVDVRVAGGDASVTVELNRDVRWTVRFTGGAQSNRADLGELRHLAGVEYVGGVSAVDLTLPAPEGSVPVRVDGGASVVRIHAPAPVRVRAGGGAGGVTIDGVNHSGVSAGSAFAADGWDAAHDRYDVDATGGVSTITADRAP